MNNDKPFIAGGEVYTINRKDIPPANETIENDISIAEAKKVFTNIMIWFRDKSSCPFNRGNWIIDFFRGDNRIIPAFSMKLPPEMKKKHFISWIKPLTENISTSFQENTYEDRK